MVINYKCKLIYLNSYYVVIYLKTFKIIINKKNSNQIMELNDILDYSEIKSFNDLKRLSRTNLKEHDYDVSIQKSLRKK